jgi:hypothetical protein
VVEPLRPILRERRAGVIPAKNITEARIRVGTFGDEYMSKDILDAMKKYF